MNFPNMLTMSRFCLSFVMVYFIFKDGGQWAWIALALFLIASLTDYWDGRLARKTGQMTVFGALMDPIADKTLTLCAFLSFWKLDLVFGIFVAIVAARDIIVTGFRLFSLGRENDPCAKMAGKRKTVIQMVYISAVLAYLAFRQRDFWQRDWDSLAMTCTQGGMLVIVLFTLWSGWGVLKSSPKPSA